MPNYFEPLPKLNLDSQKRFRVKQCPCGKSNRDGKFVPYVGHDDKGYCHACGETFLPDIKGKTDNWKPARKNKYFIQPAQPSPASPSSATPVEIFKRSLRTDLQNNFLTFLLSKFSSEAVSDAVGKYFVATSNHWHGATIFWQIDIAGKIRAGKVMLYNSATGKRVKEPYNHITWVHKVLKMDEYKLDQCFFGEHLLQGNNKPVAIVESEKTAIIASMYLPQFIWLAAGSISGTNEKKFKVLQGRNVVLYPDLNAFDLWKKKAHELSHIASFKVSDVLERNTSEQEKGTGFDLADYLLKFSLSAFRATQETAPGKIATTEIISMLGETHTGCEFNNIIIAGIQLVDGSKYDVLFDRTGEPFTENEKLNHLSTFFEKHFTKGRLDDTPCLMRKLQT